jgi:hydroxysqualene dehydroxylase
MHVCVIGGGIAGLSAATKLASKGIKVTLLEAAPQLGGRTRTVAIEYNSQVHQLDNGQHILLGAYSETLKLLEKIGVNEKDVFLRIPLNLQFHINNEIAFKFKTPSYLPAPIDQLIGFLFCYGLKLHERISAITFMVNLKKRNFQIREDEPLATFLHKNKQFGNIINLLWEPLCLAALNTPIQIASTKIFLNVLRDTFKSKSDSDFLLPKLDLSQLFSQPIAGYLRRNNVSICENMRVKNISESRNGYLVSTKDKTFDASHVIIAISPVRLRNVLGDLPKLHYIAEQTDNYNYQPITTIYLQYTHTAVLSAPMLGLAKTFSQWVFDRGILCNQHGLMAVIISAEGKHQNLTQNELAFKVAQELRAAFPQLDKPLWHKVISEKRATFSCNVNLPRPAQITPYPHLYLAGDYTYADYPATIEGAVRSGISCANLICH